MKKLYIEPSKRGLHYNGRGVRGRRASRRALVVRGWRGEESEREGWKSKQEKPLGARGLVWRAREKQLKWCTRKVEAG